MRGVILIVLIPDSCLLPNFLYSHEYRLTRNTVNFAILSDQIVVGCPLGVPISYYTTANDDIAAAVTIASPASVYYTYTSVTTADDFLL